MRLKTLSHYQLGAEQPLPAKREVAHQSHSSETAQPPLCRAASTPCDQDPQSHTFFISLFY